MQCRTTETTSASRPAPGRPLPAGFTLIELLVVIAIIAIVAAILFPVFATVRESARRATCLSNVRQLGTAVLAYAQDYDEMLPAATDYYSGENVAGAWMFLTKFGGGSARDARFDPSRGSLYPYVRSAGVYVCPSDGLGRASGNSYAFNEFVFEPGVLGFRPGKPLAAFTDTAAFAAIGEETMSPDGPPRSDSDSTNDGYLWSGGDRISFRHAGGSVLWFLDGHARWHRREQVYRRNLLTGGTPPTP